MCVPWMSTKHDTSCAVIRKGPEAHVREAAVVSHVDGQVAVLAPVGGTRARAGGRREPVEDDGEERSRQIDQNVGVACGTAGSQDGEADNLEVGVDVPGASDERRRITLPSRRGNGQAGEEGQTNKQGKLHAADRYKLGRRTG